MKKKPKCDIWIVGLAFSAIYFALLLTQVIHHDPTAMALEHSPQEDLVMPRIKSSSTEPKESRSIHGTNHLPLQEEESELRMLHNALNETLTSSPTATTTKTTTRTSTSTTTTTTLTLTLTTLSPTVIAIETRERQDHNYSETNALRNQTRIPLSDSASSATSSPNPLPTLEYNGTNSFGACLMWMDDYERLIEWIAYHYHVLPMRHLVIYRDPKSDKDPTKILERWKPYLEITYWTDIHQLSFIPQTRSILSQLNGVSRFYKLQGLFYRNCLNHLKQNKWTWTFVGDTDEFLVLNAKVLPAAPEMMEQSGIILKTLKAAQSGNEIMKMQNTTVKLINSQKQNIRWGNKATLCLCLMRQQFSGFESPQEAVTKVVPAVFDPFRFQTMRFRYHRRKTIIGKCIIDASRVSVNVYTRFSQHMLIRECGSAWGESQDLMHVNHYLGTWDYFDRPNDVRGGKDRYETFMKKNLEVNKTITGKLGDTPRKWLASFLQTFGEEKASVLLEGVGFPYNNKTALPTMIVTD